MSKDSVAKKLAEAHYYVEPGIVRIVRLLATPQQELDAREPIKLLEVNENTTADGIRPVHFGPHAASGILYPSVIVEVTPDEFDTILRDPSRLPNGWRVGEEFPRPSPAAVSH